MNTDALTSVRVIVPLGPQACTEHTFAACTADEFTAGELTVTACQSELLMAVFKRGQWVRATVYDIQGYPVFELTATEQPTLVTR